MDYVIFKSDGDEAQGSVNIGDAMAAGKELPGEQWSSMSYIGKIEADHSTAAILAAAHQWPGEGDGEWVAVRADQINRIDVTIRRVPELAPS